MAQVKVTVNGRLVDKWIEEEEGAEIQSFYRAELGSIKKATRAHITSAPSTRAVTKVKDAGNGAIRFA